MVNYTLVLSVEGTHKIADVIVCTRIRRDFHSSPHDKLSNVLLVKGLCLEIKRQFGRDD